MTGHRSLAIFGLGAFGRFMVPHLRPHFHVSVHDQHDTADQARELGVTSARLAQAAAADLIVLAVPVQSLRSLLSSIGPLVRPDATVLDVCSVKLAPIELMLELLPPSCSVIGLHPLFGPQSGRDGISNLPIALCPARADATLVDQVRAFLRDDLRLRVIDTTPDEHDRQMAYVQALTHFVSRAVGSLDLPRTPMATRAYERFLQMKADLQNDSLDLFLTIERFNPYAAQVRQSVVAAMNDLEAQISQ
ncbi:MAG: hypothetical protein GIKADHBN_01897 [Phycisphaerales bacterium]|nr:hypothetical protein [Phycisphaerales bacterium]